MPAAANSPKIERTTSKTKKTEAEFLGGLPPQHLEVLQIMTGTQSPGGIKICRSDPGLREAGDEVSRRYADLSDFHLNRVSRVAKRIGESLPGLFLKMSVGGLAIGGFIFGLIAYRSTRIN